MQAPPGDFLTSYVAMLASSGSSMDAAQVEALKQQFGLDQPVYVQYLRWMESIVRGDLGLSLEYQRPNTELIGERLLVTLLLALFAFVITWVVAIPAGIYSAMHKNTIAGLPLRGPELRRRGHAELHAGAHPDVDLRSPTSA